MNPFYAGHTGPSVLNAVMIFSAKYLVYLIPVALLDLWFTMESDAESAARMALLAVWFDRNGKSTSIFIVVTIVVSLVVSYAMGQLYSHPAPYMRGYETLLVDAPENSFPSQHATVMFAFVWPFFSLNRRRTGLVALVLAACVGISRVYVGVHYPIDIAGAIVSSLIGFALVYVARDAVTKFADVCIRVEERLRTVVLRR